jgi:hypothetical protein
VNSLHRASRALRGFQILFLAAHLFVSTSALADAVGRGAGVVRDGSGAVVAGAKVTLTRTSTNAVLTRTTDGSGAFQFLELPPDTYTLSVEAPGFKRTTLSRVVIQVDQASTLDVVLQLGQVSEVLNVDAAPPLIDTQQNTLSNVVDSQAITTMPLNSRNFLDLALLTPGATPSAGGSQVTGFNVAGARTQSNDYLIDGISNMDTQVNGGLTSFRINDAVQEFSVQTSVPTAEFGRGQGAQINAVIKSGRISSTVRRSSTFETRFSMQRITFRSTLPAASSRYLIATSSARPWVVRSGGTRPSSSFPTKASVKWPPR